MSILVQKTGRLQLMGPLGSSLCYYVEKGSYSGFLSLKSLHL